jgi:hypothetical protein
MGNSRQSKPRVYAAHTLTETEKRAQQAKKVSVAYDLVYSSQFEKKNPHLNY